MQTLIINTQKLMDSKLQAISKLHPQAALMIAVIVMPILILASVFLFTSAIILPFAFLLGWI